MTGSSGGSNVDCSKNSITKSNNGGYVLKLIKSVCIFVRRDTLTRRMFLCLHVRRCCHISGVWRHTGQFGVVLVPH